MARKALGKGLEALFPTYQEKTNEEIHEVPVSDIFPNRQQPRQKFDDTKLEELAASIKSCGVIQPIFLKRHVHGYEIVAGERRWRAAKLAGLQKVPAIIRDVSDDKKLEIALIENIQRENLNPIEEGQAYKLLIEQFQYTQQDLGEKVGKDRSTIANAMRLLKLPNNIKGFIADGLLSMGHARSILGIENDEEKVLIGEKIIQKGLSVRETESLIRRLNREREKKADEAVLKQTDSGIPALEEHLSRVLGTKIRIFHRKGKGRIEIRFSSHEEFERLLDQLNSIRNADSK
ncbi:MAG: ParB/RepB/Spo0J family partition protein [bacterium]